MKTKKVFKNVSILFAFLFIFLMSIESFVQTKAGFDFCTDLGWGFNKTPIDTESIIQQDTLKRKYTIQELFGNQIAYTIYTGEGDKGWFLGETTKEAGKAANETGKKNIEKQRGMMNCMFGGISRSFQTFSLFQAKQWTSMMNAFVTTLFSNNFVCEDANNPKGGCVNLIKITGGTSDSSNSGLIQSLTTGIYKPLMSFAILLTAIYIIYIGLIKRQFRESLQSILWTVGIFMVGTIAFMMPHSLAKLPQKVNNTISYCLVSAMNGKNCLNDNTSGSPSSMVGEECLSEASGSQYATELQVNSLSCSMWKTFVLNPWSKGQFGKPFNHLYTDKIPDNGTRVTYVGKGSDYCVNLYSGNSPRILGSEQYPSFVKRPVCNLALKHLAMTTNGDFGTPDNWGNLIASVANDKTMWDNWAPTFFGTRVASGILGSFMAMAGASAIILFSFFGHVYNFSATLLMIFAPIFFLFGVHPSRGRKIFLGYLEVLISNSLKFFASALFILISMSLFSAVLGETTGFQSFLGTIIMTGSLWIYRKEIINMIGAVNMGGQRMSNKFADVLDKTKQKTKNLATKGAMIAGGGIGSKMAGGNFSTGAKDATLRELKRGRGIVSGISRGFDKTNKSIEEDKKNQLKEKERLEQEEAMLKDKEQTAQTNKQNQEDILQQQADLQNDVNSSLKNVQSSIPENLVTITTKNPDGTITQNVMPTFGSFNINNSSNITGNIHDFHKGNTPEQARQNKSKFEQIAKDTENGKTLNNKEHYNNSKDYSGYNGQIDLSKDLKHDIAMDIGKVESKYMAEGESIKTKYNTMRTDANKKLEDLQKELVSTHNLQDMYEKHGDEQTLISVKTKEKNINKQIDKVKKDLDYMNNAETVELKNNEANRIKDLDKVFISKKSKALGKVENRIRQYENGNVKDKEIIVDEIIIEKNNNNNNKQKTVINAKEVIVDNSEIVNNKTKEKNKYIKEQRKQTDTMIHSDSILLDKEKINRNKSKKSKE